MRSQVLRLTLTETEMHEVERVFADVAGVQRIAPINEGDQSGRGPADGGKKQAREQRAEGHGQREADSQQPQRKTASDREITSTVLFMIFSASFRCIFIIIHFTPIRREALPSGGEIMYT